MHVPTWPNSSTACEIAVPTSVRNSPTCPSASAHSDGGATRTAFVRRFPSGRGDAASPFEASCPSFEAPQPMLVPPQTNKTAHPTQATEAGGAAAAQELQSAQQLRFGANRARCL